MAGADRARGVPRWLAGLIGLAVVLGAWWLLAVLVFRPEPGTTYTPLPTPWAVLSTMASDGFAPYWNIFQVTISEALVGFLWGNGLALLLASLVLVAPWLERVIVQIAVVTYCLPIVAVGGIAIIVLGGADEPGGRSSTAVFLAALCCFFTTVVGALLGFRSADRASLDLISVYGGGRVTQLRKVRLVAALPAILNALQIAVPTALLGAVLGEYMGKIDVSVGTQLIKFQQVLDSERLWALFLLSALVALIGYGLLGLVARVVTPWVSGRTR
ncbi:ABC transporter permease subunit [Nocardioides sp. GY 10113]|uniref:ABC transporter permease n=1 Tax=Nocardioides sp. GY 10113 TaxID=2569761 RepID=UPI001F10795D|nr:ABC transporter permease subunit [Nocardioides sp. GY 10113]